MSGKSKTRLTIGRLWARYALSLKYAARKNKPLLLWRTLKDYLRLLLTGRPPLRYVDLAVTYNCNLNCIHCSASRMAEPARRTMTVEDYAALGEQLADSGVLVVQLTGGEPSLHPQIEEIIRVLKPSRFFMSMGTNASHMTRERIERLKRAGLDNLCVSIDDGDPAEHDRWRGAPGLHARALETIDAAIEAGLAAMIFTVVSHQNVRSNSFLKLVEYTRRKNILLLVGWAVPVGNWNGKEDILLTAEDLEYLEEIHKEHLHVRTDFESNYYRWGCGAAKEKLYITPYGDVIPCAFVHVRLGNVFEKPLAEIRRTALKIPWFARYNGLCLAANDREFQRLHLSRVWAAAKEPITMREAGFDVDE